MTVISRKHYTYCSEIKYMQNRGTNPSAKRRQNKKR